jgi:hypothetical protein
LLLLVLVCYAWLSGACLLFLLLLLLQLVWWVGCIVMMGRAQATGAQQLV